MQPFSFESTDLPGLTVVRPFVAGDDRGYMMKCFEQETFREQGISFSPCEELISKSAKGVLRGLHFQWRNCQAKLVRVLSGAVYDVAVDLRKDSPTFGQWRSFTLSGEAGAMLYLPQGFAHGFLALEDTMLHYLCAGRYDPDWEDGIIWNDPDLSIPWPVDQTGGPVLSGRDRQFKSMREHQMLTAEGGVICGS